MIVVSDTSPIRALAQVDMLHLLTLLYETVYVPPAVAEELRRERSPLKSVEVNAIHGIEVQTPGDNEHVSDLLRVLDIGESQAIALAIEVGCKRILIDERKGRNIAEREGLEPVGVMGVLAQAKNQGYIDSIAPILQTLRRDFQFFLSADLVRRYLENLGESLEDA